MRRFHFLYAAFLVLAACAPAAPGPSAGDTPPTERTFTLRGDRYENAANGFSLTATSGATVWEREEYIRLQNYPPDAEGIGLEPGTYYVEIHVAKDPSEECADGVVDGKDVTIDGARGLRGNGASGGDAGGERFALCVESSDRQFFVIATENDPEGPIANAILDSFRLEP